MGLKWLKKAMLHIFVCFLMICVSYLEIKTAFSYQVLRFSLMTPKESIREPKRGASKHFESCETFEFCFFFLRILTLFPTEED